MYPIDFAPEKKRNISRTVMCFEVSNEIESGSVVRTIMIFYRKFCHLQLILHTEILKNVTILSQRLTDPDSIPLETSKHTTVRETSVFVFVRRPAFHWLAVDGFGPKVDIDVQVWWQRGIYQISYL